MLPVIISQHQLNVCTVLDLEILFLFYEMNQVILFFYIHCYFNESLK